MPEENIPNIDFDGMLLPIYPVIFISDRPYFCNSWISPKWCEKIVFCRQRGPNACVSCTFLRISGYAYCVLFLFFLSFYHLFRFSSASACLGSLQCFISRSVQRELRIVPAQHGFHVIIILLPFLCYEPATTRCSMVLFKAVRPPSLKSQQLFV